MHDSLTALKTHLHHGMPIVASQQHAHGRRRLLGFARQKGAGVAAVKALLVVKQYHLLRLALGVQIGDNLEGTARLHQRHLHVQTAEVDAENGAGFTGGDASVKELVVREKGEERRAPHEQSGETEKAHDALCGCLLVLWSNKIGWNGFSIAG